MTPEASYFRHIRVTVLDSVGCGRADRPGYSRDADIYDRSRSENEGKPPTPVNTLLNASQRRQIDAPALEQLGITELPDLRGLKIMLHKGLSIVGAYGELSPDHIDNGSPAGHQALMGYLVEEPYMYFDETGFSPEIVDLVEKTASEVLRRKVQVVRYPGTDDVNGVRFINTKGIGDEHVKSTRRRRGKLILPMYASSDSLIQLAVHEPSFPKEVIWDLGRAVRGAVDTSKKRICRIIVRPFEDDPEEKDGQYKRISEHRKDFTMDPDGLTLLDLLAEANIPVDGYGKAASMFNFRGFPAENVIPADNGEEKMKRIVADFSRKPEEKPRFSLDNITEFDELFGHRKKPEAYIEYLNLIAGYIAQGMLAMAKCAPDDLWVITADHGNDPTQQNHTNHTNEKAPIFVFSPRMKNSLFLGVRDSFADLGKTIAENYGLGEKIKSGKSFLPELVEVCK